jgi:NAD-dependent protein deacetylase/lipoamidase
VSAAPGTQHLVAQAADLIRQSRHTVALTGAGISTPSGIPDFRSPGSGLWTKFDPADVASIEGFIRNPAAYYEWRQPLAATLRNAQPNAAHRALASLEVRGLLNAVITQNIDGLHQSGGARRVLEVHGRGRELICLTCHQVVNDDESVQRQIERGEVPYCPVCGGLLKPNVVFFGEVLPRGVIFQVSEEVRACELMLVVGSSLEVMPACLWPQDAVQHGARLIIINYQPTYVDERASVVIRDDVAQVLPAIVAALGD